MQANVRKLCASLAQKSVELHRIASHVRNATQCTLHCVIACERFGELYSSEPKEALVGRFALRFVAFLTVRWRTFAHAQNSRRHL